MIYDKVDIWHWPRGSLYLIYNLKYFYIWLRIWLTMFTTILTIFDLYLSGLFLLEERLRNCLTHSQTVVIRHGDLQQYCYPRFSRGKSGGTEIWSIFSTHLKWASMNGPSLGNVVPMNTSPLFLVANKISPMAWCFS